MPTLNVNDASLFYQEAGTGASVVLLHGLGSSTVDWEPELTALTRRYRVIAIDARGSGQSRDLTHPRGPFTVAQFAADTAAVIDHLDAGPAHIVGLSMGGMVAFQLAVDHPASVRTLTIVNSGPALVPRTRQERTAIALRLVISRLFGPRGMARMLAPRLFPLPDQGPLRERFKAGMARNDKGAYIATQRALIGWSVLDRIGAIDVPVLVVASDQDYGFLSAKEAYTRMMKRAELVVVPDARHALPMEDPPKFLAVLEPFLARHAVPAVAAR